MSKEIQLLEYKINHSTSDEEKLEGMLTLVELYTNTKNVEGWKLANVALALSIKLGDKTQIAKSHEGIATTAWKLAEYTLSLEHYTSAVEMYQELDNLHGVAKCYCGMGIICGTTEEYQTALEYFDAALEMSKKANRPELSANVTSNIGHIYFNFGRYHDAMDCFQKGLNYYQGANQNANSANMLSGMAGVHVYLGEYQLGLNLVRKANQLYRKTNNKRGVVISTMNTGIALLRMGKLEKAEQELIEALTDCREIGLKTNEFEIIKHLIEVYDGMGNKLQLSKFKELLKEGMIEEKRASLKRKQEQLKEREEIKRFNKAS